MGCDLGHLSEESWLVGWKHALVVNGEGGGEIVKSSGCLDFW